VRIRSTLAMLAAALLPAATVATAAVGSIEFQKVDVSFSGKDGRPEAPVIVASNKDADGKWRATDDPVRFKVRVHVTLNARSDVTRIALGVPAIGAPQSTWPVFSMEPHLSAREAMCAAANRSGKFKLPFSLDVQVEVSAKRGVRHDESRRHIFDRKLPAEIKCIAVSHTVAEPQRTTGSGRPIYVEVDTRLPDAKYAGVLRKTVRFAKPFRGTYRVLAINPFGAPVPSPWAVLDVKC